METDSIDKLITAQQVHGVINTNQTLKSSGSARSENEESIDKPEQNLNLIIENEAVPSDPGLDEEWRLFVLHHEEQDESCVDVSILRKRKEHLQGLIVELDGRLLEVILL